MTDHAADARLSLMDTRLEGVFKAPRVLGPVRRQPSAEETAAAVVAAARSPSKKRGLSVTTGGSLQLPPAAARIGSSPLARGSSPSARARGGASPAGGNQSRTSELLQLLQVSRCGSEASRSSAAQLERWLSALAGQREDALLVGRECMQVVGAEFDEHIASMSGDLKFLHSLCGGQALLPRATAESCLEHGESVVRLWQGSRRVVVQMMAVLEAERARLREDSSEEYANGLRERIGVLRNTVVALESDKADLQATVNEYRQMFDDLSHFEQGEEIALLRQRVTEVKPSGLPPLLRNLLNHLATYDMRLLAKGDFASAGVRAAAAAAADSRHNKPRKGKGDKDGSSSDSGSDSEGEPRGARAGRGASVASSTPLSSSPAGGPLSGVLAGAGVGEDDDVEEGDQDEDENEGGGGRDRIESLAPLVGRASPSGARGRLRRKSIAVQDTVEKLLKSMDPLQRAHVLSQHLQAQALDETRSTVNKLSSAKQQSLGQVVLEAVGDGKMRAFLRDVFKRFETAKDRADLMMELTTAMTEDELVLFSPMLAQHPVAVRVAALLKESQKQHGENDKDQRDYYVQLVHQLNAKLGAVDDAACQTEGLEVKEAPTSPEAQGRAGVLKAISARIGRAFDLTGDGEEELAGAGAGVGASAGADEGADVHEGADAHARPGVPRLQKVEIKNERLLRTGGEVSVVVLVREAGGKKSQSTEEKYLAPPPKGLRVRKVDRAILEEDVIGEVFMKKVVTDKAVRAFGAGGIVPRKSHSLMQSLLHYFTQKYGLKKMAEDYLYGVVAAVREHAAESTRIQVFGQLAGIIDPDRYSPILCSVVVEVLAICFRHDLISKFFQRGNGQTFINDVLAQRAVRNIFKVVEGEAIRAGDAKPVVPSDADDFDVAGIRSWALPLLMRQELLRWIDDNAVRESDVVGTSERVIKVVDCDKFLEQVVECVKNKIEVDTQMLKDLFAKFDRNRDGVLSEEEFRDLINACQPVPPLGEGQIMDLWIEVNEAENDGDSDKITPEGFASVCVDKNLQLPYWKHDTDNRMHKLLADRRRSTMPPASPKALAAVAVAVAGQAPAPGPGAGAATATPATGAKAP